MCLASLGPGPSMVLLLAGGSVEFRVGDLNVPGLALIPSTALGDCVGEKGKVRRDAGGVAADEMLE
jgi:hypothetical protein